MRKSTIVLILFAVVCVLALLSVGCSQEIADVIEDPSDGKTDFRPPEIPSKTYTVTFVKDGKTVYETKVLENAKVEEYVLTDEPFNVWYYNGEAYDFNKPVTSGLLLNAVNAKSFSLVFIADGEIVESTSYSHDSQIVEPAVPHKDFYEGEWSEYLLCGGDITVTARYEPIEYNLTYYLDDGIFITTCTIERPPENVPEVPVRQAYDGVWNYSATGNDVSARPYYIPIEYTVNYFIESELCFSTAVNIENASSRLPAIKDKPHYAAEWEEFDFSNNPINVNLIYTPLEYFVRFYCEGELYREISYNIENTAIEEPKVPERTHYTGSWTEYDAVGGDIEVNAVYTLVEYEVNFRVDGEIIKTCKYTIKTVSVESPPIPPKAGYTAKWEDYSLDGGNVEVNAVYEPILAGTVGLVYTLTGSEYTVTGYNGADGEVVVPPIYDGLPVTAIGKKAFSETKITSIEVSEGITALGEGAFLYCADLETVNLPQTLTEIPTLAFSGCTSLKYIKIPFGVGKICEQAFCNSGLETVGLPETLESIESYAFYGCGKLRKIDIPDSVLSIGANAFSSCNLLTEIILGASLNFIGINAFYNCTNLSGAYFKDPDNWTVQGEDSPEIATDVSYLLSDPDTASEYLVNMTNKYFIKNSTPKRISHSESEN